MEEAVKKAAEETDEQKTEEAMNNVDTEDNVDYMKTVDRQTFQNISRRFNIFQNVTRQDISRCFKTRQF